MGVFNNVTIYGIKYIISKWFSVQVKTLLEKELEYCMIAHMTQPTLLHPCIFTFYKYLLQYFVVISFYLRAI